MAVALPEYVHENHASILFYSSLTSNTVEGVFTISVSIVFLFFIPGSPDCPKPLLSPGLIRFTDADQQVLQERLAGENRGGAQGLVIPLKVVWRAVSQYYRWPHFISTFVVFSTWSPLTTYTPSIIMCVTAPERGSPFSITRLQWTRANI